MDSETTSTTLIAGGLTTLIVLLAIAAWLFLTWQKKRQKHHEFELLLDDIKQRQDSRVGELARLLGEKFGMESGPAKKTGLQLLEAEKLFLQQFIDQQLQQKTVEPFYTQLCELLDGYLAALPKTATPPASAKPEAKTQTAPAEPEEIPEAVLKDEAEDGATNEQEWGDVFD